VLITGYGSNGIVRYRERKPADVAPPDFNAYVQHYNRGKQMARNGGDIGFGEGVGGTSKSLVHGLGHNLLGAADMWDPAVQALSDAGLLTTMGADDMIDPSDYLYYLRYNGGQQPEVPRSMIPRLSPTNVVTAAWDSHDPCRNDCLAKVTDALFRIADASLFEIDAERGIAGVGYLDLSPYKIARSVVMVTDWLQSRLDGCE
jgi:hypothetical protein